MVEQSSDSIRLPGGLIGILLKWVFFRAWTGFGILAFAYGLYLLVLTQLGSISVPGQYAETISRFDIPLVLIYSVSLLVLGGLVAWLNALVGNQTIRRRHRYAYQIAASAVIIALLVWGAELHRAVLSLFGLP